MATLRFISDSAHGWLEVPTVDVAAAGVTPSRYSYIDATTGMTYLEEDCDAAKYLKLPLRFSFDLAVLWDGIKEEYIDGECWVRALPRCDPRPEVLVVWYNGVPQIRFKTGK